MSEETKQCPFCAETIQKAAIVCRYCGRDLVFPATPPLPTIIRSATSGVWVCSACSAPVKPGAPTCPRCRVTFESTEPVPILVTQKRKDLPIRLIFLIVTVIAGLAWYGNNVFGPQNGLGGPRVFDRLDAWIDCKNFVTKSLKAPASAQFPASNDPSVTVTHFTNGRWQVDAYVDAENSFGAQLRQSWSCQVSTNGTTATLQKLTLGDQVLLDQ